MAIIRSEDNKFEKVKIPDLVFESNLSFQAMGVLGYLISKGDGHRATIAELLCVTKGTEKPTGKDGIYTILDELKRAGLVFGNKLPTGKYEYSVSMESQDSEMIDFEYEAVKAIDKMVEDNGDYIRYLWCKGDGFGGYVIQQITNKLGLESKDSSKKVRRCSIPKDIRKFIFKRDGNSCNHCGSTEDLTIDHIKPVALGGDDSLGNLQTLCRSCNSKKGISEKA